jgi:hypothetical protein
VALNSCHITESILYPTQGPLMHRPQSLSYVFARRSCSDIYTKRISAHLTKYIFKPQTENLKNSLKTFPPLATDICVTLRKKWQRETPEKKKVDIHRGKICSKVGCALRASSRLSKATSFGLRSDGGEVAASLSASSNIGVYLARTVLIRYDYCSKAGKWNMVDSKNRFRLTA